MSTLTERVSTVSSKSTWIIQLTCIFWIIAKAISWKLWTTDRLFPLVPVLPFLKDTPGWIHLLLYGISVACLLAVLAKPDKRILPILLFSEVISCLLDYNRIQPWEYQYGLMVVAVLVNKKDSSALGVVAFILAALYIYSGLGKLNPGFLSSVWNRMLLSGVFHFSDEVRYNFFVYRIGYFIPIIETLLGISLLFRRTQKKGAVALIIMHLSILLWLGPLGKGYNVIVWPWNLAMCYFLYELFVTRSSAISYSALRQRGNQPIVVLCGILPLFSFFGLWDHYLSASLYSGKTGKFILKTTLQDHSFPLTPYFEKKTDTDSLQTIRAQNWALKELKVPPYPETRVYTSVKLQLEERYPKAGLRYFIYSSKGIQELK